MASQCVADFTCYRYPPPYPPDSLGVQKRKGDSPPRYQHGDELPVPGTVLLRPFLLATAIARCS